MSIQRVGKKLAMWIPGDGVLVMDDSQANEDTMRRIAAVSDLLDVARMLIGANKGARNDAHFISKIALVQEYALAAIAKAEGRAPRANAEQQQPAQTSEKSHNEKESEGNL